MKPCTGIIASEAYPFLIPLAALLVVFYFLKWNWALGLTLLLTLFVAYFFRNPERVIPTGEGVVVSPADGKVIVIKEVFEDQYLKKNMLQISIFLNVFNVHIQRVPISGQVKEVRYHPGKFLAAWDDKASLDNEQVGMVLDTGKHAILVKQIAGLVARRIACWASTGEKIQMGDRYGLIRFGSRVDIFLPVGTEVKVKLGDKTVGGETILGVIREGV